MDIKCKKTSCQHNKDYACQAKKILISKNNICSSYKKQENKGEDKTKKIFTSTTETYAPFVHCKNFCIDCQSNCLFKINNECCANGITINDVSENAVCVTHKDND